MKSQPAGCSRIGGARLNVTRVNTGPTSMPMRMPSCSTGIKR